MAAKRTATTDLNHENWDQEDEPEEAGTFQKASESSLKTRIIRTAKRRNPISSVRQTGESEKKNVFSGFSGFSKIPSNTSFVFLSNTAPKTEQTKVNGFPPKTTDSSAETKDIKTTTKCSSNENPDKPSEYYSKLKGLNESVSKWIKHHVDANPFINLQPIFRDYEKYFKQLESDKDNKETEKNEAKQQEESASFMANFKFKTVENVPDSTTGKLQEDKKNSKNSSSSSQFSFGSVLTSTTTKPTTLGYSSNKADNFSFGGISATSSTCTTNTNTSMFSFGSGSTATIPSFSFGSSTPISFGSAPAPAANPNSPADTNQEEEAEDEPPKVEFTPVVEKDYLYTIRCKMFVKKDKEYVDRGVGNLFLKSVENSEKVQVILRADTNLGNLLCNFILSESIPVTRMGKKDVMLVCLPNPDEKPPPVPVLFRVKSPEDADKLFETLQKHKK